MYHILPYTYKQAKKIGVLIYPSDNKRYKLEVYDNNGFFLCYVGSSNYSDYPHYILSHGKEYADVRRRLYKIRHAKDRQIIGSRGFFADQLLW